GLLSSIGLTRIIQPLLFGVSPMDPITLVAVSAFLMCVSVAASYLPARKAAGIDPARALRYE
ncbi:MAG TPA: hypothetical protein VEZ90_14600, partial [Blastocatellia bacterium]|nr:hypothetical protein [Blastocatellia bacterium]